MPPAAGKSGPSNDVPTIFTLGDDVLGRLQSVSDAGELVDAPSTLEPLDSRPKAPTPTPASDAVPNGTDSNGSLATGPAGASEDASERKAWSCATCRVSFDSANEQRQHYKLDWHRYNVKRKLKSSTAAPMTEDEFDALAEKADGNLSEGSLSGSDSEAEDDGGAGSKKNEAGGALDSTTKSPFVVINVPLPPDHVAVVTAANGAARGGEGETAMDLVQQYQIYRTVLYNPRTTQAPSAADLASRLKQLSSSPQAGRRRLWTFLLLSSGHLAFAVFDAVTMEAVAHTTKHRYTVRRKQGGAQSGNDGSKSAVAHSAGAELRRYNEQMLREEVREVLKQHEQLLDESELLFVQASGSSNQRVIFGYEGAVLRRDDERIRSIPFTTKRPTFSECERCAKELRTVKVRIVDLEVARRERQAAQAREAAKELKKKTAEAPKPAKVEKEKEKVDAEAEKLVELISRGKLEPLQKLIAGAPELLTTRFPESPISPSALHLAAASGQPEIVTYLLTTYPESSDPTALNSRKQSPYDVAVDRETRNAFRKVRALADFAERWDWNRGHVPEALTDEMEEAQKKKEREKMAKEREKEKERKEKEREKERVRAEEERKKQEAAAAEREKKAATEKRLKDLKLASTPSSAATQGSYKLSGGARPPPPQAALDTLTPEARARVEREKRALAAEWRARTATGKCTFCGVPLNTLGNQVFERMGWKYCSMNCLNGHREYT
ncbi:hypothetical protein DFJ74DRAFT_756676 [Hyaloraphidium curvatum]|nr:hypothetical protein DFJ74DRAFT_756676 [Hyaloraphidium curvatum]